MGGTKALQCDKRRASAARRTWRFAARLVSSVLCCASLILGGCSGDHAAQPPEPKEEGPCTPGSHYDFYRMDFGLDYRDSGTLRLSATCDELEGTFSVIRGNTLLAAGHTYSGKGRRYRFPETGDVLYTLKVSAPPPSDQGPCGESEISLSLSLSGKKGSSYLVGGLTAYCGKDTYYGRPARVMRVSGTLEQER